MIAFDAVALPGSCGMTSAASSEGEARIAAYDYAMLLLDNDAKRQRVNVTLRCECFACGGAGSYPAKSKRVFGKLKPCAVCKGDALEFATYSVTRE